jgi:ADP-dependent NAD(P)H-hydrate dehydratase / NAD(P)H-hydrate epimerase
MPEFEPLYTAEEMRAAEAGHDVDELMDRAGRSVAEFILDEYGSDDSVTVVCGPGNNGGDGRVAAAALREADVDVRVVDAKDDDAVKQLGSPGVVVDALFGTGFSGEPRAAAARVIEAINDLGVDVVAVDVPSGVDASTGEVAGVAVDVDATLSFHRDKVGLHVAPGSFHRGEIELVDIGLDDERETAHALVTGELLERIPLRAPSDTKYTAGSVLVVGGSPGLTGAVVLSARAAFRADAGYVAVAAPRESLPVLEQQLLEAVKRPLEDVWDAVSRATAVAVGPGLGRSDDARALVRRLLEETDLPVVLDADALFELEPFDREAPTVMTPHSGELARLLDEEPSWVDGHRLEAARRAVERFGCTVLLKGDGTIVAAADEQVLICPGFPSLATAGTGDVLTGIIAAFLAKGVDPRIAAAAGATAHSEAAAEAPQRAGLVASDVVEMLPFVLGS